LSFIANPAIGSVSRLAQVSIVFFGRLAADVSSGRDRVDGPAECPAIYRGYPDPAKTTRRMGDRSRGLRSASGEGVVPALLFFEL
jgi:hypothetical protein